MTGLAPFDVSNLHVMCCVCKRMEIELLYCTHAAPSPAVVQSTGVTVGAKVVAWLRRRAKSDEVSRASARCSVVLGVVVVDAVNSKQEAC